MQNMLANFVKRLGNFFGHKAVVLMYHRIADVKYDPWQLSVSPANFEQQLKVLKDHFKVIPVSELIQQVHNNHIRKDAVCLTFDDGYADNYLAAKPLLEKYNCPATFFIASKYIGAASQFWWDELEDIMLGSSRLPSSLSLEINGDQYEFTISPGDLAPGQVEQQKAWQWPAPPPTDRCKLYLDIWEILLPLDYDVIKGTVDKIRLWANYGITPPEGKIPMSPLQLQKLTANDLFELGIHTDTHPALSFHPKAYQQNEIIKCRDYLEHHYRHTVNAVAYPYGRFNDLTVNVIKGEEIAAGFTTEGRIINRHADPYKLGRLQVNNWSGDHFKQQLKRWSK